jgi:hypothetical protein
MASTGGDNDFLLKLLRVSLIRSRLLANTINSVGIALKRGIIDCDSALAWLEEEGVHIDLPTPASDQEAA